MAHPSTQSVKKNYLRQEGGLTLGKTNPENAP